MVSLSNAAAGIRTRDLLIASPTLYSALSYTTEWLRERTEYVPHCETEKITRKASDTAENLQLYRVVRFFRPRSSCTTTHLMLFSERPPPCVVVHDDLG